MVLGALPGAAGAAGALEDVQASGSSFQITVVAPTQESEQYLLEKLGTLPGVKGVEVVSRKDLRYGSTASAPPRQVR